ncbi:hypothetical protein AADR41_18990 [Streptomyces sp. CLV115]|uniref:hypothetical protein n=1 Tax=Streptomyces sp. CLV115 TaxID=3138502 RepID=UPI00313B56CF
MTVDGSRNTALPVLAAAAALCRPVQLSNVPTSADVNAMLTLLQHSGHRLARAVGDRTTVLVLGDSFGHIAPAQGDLAGHSAQRSFGLPHTGRSPAEVSRSRALSGERLTRCRANLYREMDLCSTARNAKDGEGRPAPPRPRCCSGGFGKFGKEYEAYMLSLCADQLSYANRVDGGIDFFKFLAGFFTAATLFIVLQVAIAIVTILLSLAFGNLLGRRLNGWLRQIFEPTSSRQQERADEFAEQYMQNAVAHIESVASGISSDERSRLVSDIKTWHANSHLWTARQAAALALTVWLLMNITHIRNTLSLWVGEKCQKSMGSGVGHDAQGCNLGWTDSLGALWDPKVDFVRERWGDAKTAVLHPLEHPAHTATTAAVALLLVVVIMMAYPLTSAVWYSLHRRLGRDFPGAGSSPAAARPGLVSEVNRCWPTVRLLNICKEVGHAHNQLETGGEVSLVSLKHAESAVYSAWRSRYRRKVFARSQEFSEHAELAVGALRAAEVRQERESDTKKVLEDTHAMLLKISNRYTAGLTLALLDAEDLEGVEPAVRRKWVKAAFAVIIMGGIAAGATALDAPEEVWTPLVTASPVLAWGIAYMRPARIAETLALWNGSGRHRAE